MVVFGNDNLIISWPVDDISWNVTRRWQRLTKRIDQNLNQNAAEAKLNVARAKPTNNDEDDEDEEKDRRKKNLFLS